MSELNDIKKILERERLARKEAERILEAKSLEIFNKSKEIELLKESLKNEADNELKKLAARQDFLKLLFETHPLAIVIVDRKEEVISEMNKQGEYLFGSKPLDKPLKFKDLCEIDFALNENDTTNLDWIHSVSKMRKSNGELFDVNLTKIATEYNAIPSFVIVISDQTENVALRKQSDDNERKYQNLIEKSSDIIYSINDKGFFLYMNPVGLNLLGYSLDEIQSINFADLVQVNFRDRVTHFYSYQIESKTKSTYSEFPIESKDGVEHWLGQNVDMSFNGSEIDITVVARVVTEKKRLEKEILRSEEKYRSLINNLELGLVEVDNDGIIRKAHPSFCSMVGYSKEEIEGTSGDFMLNDEARQIMLEQKERRSKGVLGLYEIQLLTKTGEIIWVMISGAPTYDHNNKINGSIGIHLNITEQKKLENELRLTAKVAKDSLKSKELFLANISHEMRTPLNGIIGLSELINDDVNANNDLKSKTESILLSSRNLLNLIDDLLLFTKIENKKIELSPDFYNLNSSLHILMQTHEIAAAKKGIRFEHKNNVPVNVEYFIDVYRLHQILNNIISNAIKFTSKGGVEVESSIVHSSGNYDIIQFNISDSGIGIPEGEIDKIFGSFEQATNNDVKTNGGTGLGLSIVKELTNMMGAELDLETSTKGTKFSLEFKLNKHKVVDSEKQPVDLLTDDFKGFRVLIAEDNKVNQQVIINMLKKLNVEIDLALDGNEAIEKFKQKEYDIVFMDLRMPGLDGFEATSKIRLTNENIPIIATTANTTIGSKNEYINKGFTDLLSKPFTKSDLLNIIKKYENKTKSDIAKNLLDVTESDYSFAKELALIFLEDCEQRLELLDLAVKNKEMKKINSIAHSMKPSLFQLGDKEIQGIVIKLETTVNWSEEIEKLIEKFIDLLGDMLKEIQNEVVPYLDEMS